MNNVSPSEDVIFFPLQKTDYVDPVRIEFYRKQLNKLSPEKRKEIMGLWKEARALEDKEARGEKLTWDEKERHERNYSQLHLLITKRLGNPAKGFFIKDPSQEAVIGRPGRPDEDLFIRASRLNPTEVAIQNALGKVA